MTVWVRCQTQCPQYLGLWAIPWGPVLAHKYIGLVSVPCGSYSENVPEFSSLFPPVAEDGVPRTARSMSLTLGKVCMFKEYQGSQRKYSRSFQSPRRSFILDPGCQRTSGQSLTQLPTPASHSIHPSLAHGFPDCTLREHKMMHILVLPSFSYTIQYCTQIVEVVSAPFLQCIIS